MWKSFGLIKRTKHEWRVHYDFSKKFDGLTDSNLKLFYEIFSRKSLLWFVTARSALFPGGSAICHLHTTFHSSWYTNSSECQNASSLICWILQIKTQQGQSRVRTTCTKSTQDSISYLFFQKFFYAKILNSHFYFNKYFPSRIKIWILFIREKIIGMTEIHQLGSLI